MRFPVRLSAVTSSSVASGYDLCSMRLLLIALPGFARTRTTICSGGLMETLLYAEDNTFGIEVWLGEEIGVPKLLEHLVVGEWVFRFE